MAQENKKGPALSLTAILTIQEETYFHKWYTDESLHYGIRPSGTSIEWKKVSGVITNKQLQLQDQLQISRSSEPASTAEAIRVSVCQGAEYR